MSKLEQIQSQAVKTMEYYYDRKIIDEEINEIKGIITEVWNEAIKECEGCVPEMKKKNSIKHFSGNSYFNQQGFNQCRNQTLQAIRKIMR